jgi:hypothetical protein
LQTFSISIGTLSVKVRSKRAHAKGQTITIQVDGCALHQAWTAAKVCTLAALRDLLARYEAHQAEEHKQFMAKLPPHNLLCEKRCCQKSFRAYHQFLKKQLVWGRDGHLQ